MENHLHSVDETVDIVAYIYFQRYANLLQNIPSEIFCLMFCEFAQSSISVDDLCTAASASSCLLQDHMKSFFYLTKVQSSGTNLIYFHRYMQHCSILWFGIRSTLHSICSRYVSFLLTQQQKTDFLEFNDQQILQKLCYLCMCDMCDFYG